MVGRETLGAEGRAHQIKLMWRRSLLISALAWPALAQVPPGVAAHLERGHAWRRLDEFRAAIAEYDTALRLAPGHPLAMAHRGVTWHRIGEQPQAWADVDAAVAAAGPHEGWPYAARAGLLILAGDLPRAAADLAEAQHREPDALEVLALAAILRVRQGGPVPATPPPRLDEVRLIFGPWLVMGLPL